MRDRVTLADWGLRDEQINALAELPPRIKRAHEQVSALGLPRGPAHGDAQPMNALFDKDGKRYVVRLERGERRASLYGRWLVPRLDDEPRARNPAGVPQI